MKYLILTLALALTLVSCANPDDNQPQIVPTSAILSPHYTHHYLV